MPKNTYIINRVILALLCLVLLSISSQAQLFWTSYPGAGSFQFASIFEDQKGFIWLGNKASIHRFDGNSWDSFILNDSLNANIISITEGPNQDLWVGLDNGDIYFSRNSSWQKFDPEEGTPKKAIRSLFFDQEDRLWIVTYGEGLYYYQEERMYNIDVNDCLPSNDLYTGKLDKEGNIWCASDRGLAIVSLKEDRKQVVLISEEDGLPDQICTTLEIQEKAKLWVGTYEGSIASIDMLSRQISKPISISHNQIDKIISSNDNVWVLDHEGKLWKRNAIQSQLIPFPIPIKDIYLDSSSRIWVIDEDNRLHSAQSYLSLLVEAPEAIEAIEANNKGALWIGTPNGLYRYQLKTSSWEAIPRTEKLHISSLYQDAFGRLWIGTLGEGLWQYEKSQSILKPYPLKDNSSKIPILSISGNAEELWIATFGGAYRGNFDKSGNIIRQTHFQEADELGINYIYQTYTEAKGKTLLATDAHGLGIWDNKNLHIEQKLNGSSILSLSVDEKGGIWLLDDEGQVLYQFEHAVDTLFPALEQQALAIQALSAEQAIIVYEHSIYLADKEKQLRFSLLDEGQHKGFGKQLNALSTGPDNHLYIAAKEGVILLERNEIPENLAPSIQLKSLQINLGTQIEFKEVLEADENHLNIEYAGIWYQNPSAVNFRYKLSGRDLNWIYSKNSNAVYADLKPGNYHFEIQAGVQENFQGEHSQIYSFRVKKPIWQHPLFIFTSLITAIVLAIWAIRVRESRIRASEELRRQNAEHQFETLRSQINPHFLFNAFSTLTDIVEENPKDAINYINRLSDMFRDTLTYRNESLISLEEEIKILKNYYALQKERYGNNFHMQLEIRPDMWEKKLPPLVLQILVENALKHNIASKEKPLHVRVHAEGNRIRVENSLQKRSSKASSTQLGLQNIQERFKLLSDRPIEIEENQFFTVSLPLLD